MLALATLSLALLATTACQPLPGAAPGGTAPDCRDVPWGSAAKTAVQMTTAPIVRVRTGSHRCFDRMVVDLRNAPGAGWRVRYGKVRDPGMGYPIGMRANTHLEVIVQAPTHDARGRWTFDPPSHADLADVSSYRTFRQIALAGSFEGETTFGIGVRSRLPFRVFAVEGPSGTKLVVDVAHRWP